MTGEKRGPILVIVLCLITCGLYFYYWIYKVDQEFKANLGDDSINPGMDAVLSFVTCGVWTWFWFYKAGGWQKALWEKAGKQTQDDTILYLALAIFFAPAAIFILQDRLNQVYP